MKKLIIVTVLFLVNGVSVNLINAETIIPRTPATPVIPKTAGEYCVVLQEAQLAFDNKEAAEYINKLAEEQKENEAKAKEAKTKKEKEAAAKEALELEVKAQLVNALTKNISNQTKIEAKTKTEQTRAEEAYKAAQDVADAAKVTARTAVKAVIMQ